MSSELDVYKLADLLQHKQLKSAVVDNFTYLLNNNWDHASFPAAIEKVYDITPPGKEGDILRKVAVHCVSRLSRHLFQHHPDFVTFLESLPELSSAVVRVLSGTDPDFLFGFTPTRLMGCQGCLRTYHVGDTTELPNLCPAGCRTLAPNGGRLTLDEHLSYRATAVYECPALHVFKVHPSEMEPDRVLRCVHCELMAAPVNAG